MKVMVWGGGREGRWLECGLVCSEGWYGCVLGGRLGCGVGGCGFVFVCGLFGVGLCEWLVVVVVLECVGVGVWGVLGGGVWLVWVL